MTPASHLKQRSESGFTLVELMVAITLGVLMTAGLTSLLVVANQNYRQDAMIARLQDELRFAMTQLIADLEMAGFWGPMLNPAGIVLDTSLAISADCGPSTGSGPAGTWVYGNRVPLDYVNNATSTAANTRFPCISAAAFRGGTDVLAIKRIASVPTYSAPPPPGTDARTDMEADHVYLQTNGVLGTLFQHESAVAGVFPTPDALVQVPAPRTYWAYIPRVYYIRNYASTAGDGIPSLCRERLTVASGIPAFASQCIARGIEDLQLEFGIDSGSDGVADFFVETPTAAQLVSATAVRITLLARSEEAVPSYTNPKTYQLTPTHAVTPQDHHYRRSLTATVLLRNPAALRRLQ